MAVLAAGQELRPALAADHPRRARFALASSARTTGRCLRWARITPPGSGTRERPGRSPCFGRGTSGSSTAASARTAEPSSPTTRAASRILGRAERPVPRGDRGPAEPLRRLRKVAFRRFGRIQDQQRPSADAEICRQGSHDGGRLRCLGRLGRAVGHRNGPPRGPVGRARPHDRQFMFLGERWVTTLEGSSTLLVFSAEDGRLVARLNHPADEVVEHVDVSPSGRQVATSPGSSRSAGGLFRLREWDRETWQAQTLTTHSLTGVLRFWMDDAVRRRRIGCRLGTGKRVDRLPIGQNEPLAEFPAYGSFFGDHLGRAGDLAHGGNGWVYDTRTWQRLLPPPGRKFHPDLARFAPDGRFVVAAINREQVVIDTRTEKSFPMNRTSGATCRGSG